MSETRDAVNDLRNRITQAESNTRSQVQQVGVLPNPREQQRPWYCLNKIISSLSFTGKCFRFTDKYFRCTKTFLIYTETFLNLLKRS